MKITFVLADPTMSGGDRVCAIYAQKLIQLGHTVNLITPKKRNSSFREQLKRLLKGHSWSSKKKQSLNHFDLLGLEVIFADGYAPLTEKSVPDSDIIIATWWETAEWVKGFSNEKGKKVYFIQHYETHTGQPIERVKNTYRLPFHKITIANWLVSLMEKEYASVPPYLVPNSVDHELFYTDARKKQSTPTIGFLFSEIEFKGVDIALKVIQKLKTKIPNLRVITFGSHPAVTLDLPKYIELSINPKQEGIQLLYQQCDLWLCCSLIEGFGLTILEAMACRTPIISTKCGGPEDIITENVNGYLCEVNDVDALTDASFKILNFSEHEWQSFSGNAHKHATSYTWDDTAKLFEAALEDIKGSGL